MCWFMRCNSQAGDFGACDCPSSSLKKYSHCSHVFMVRESNKMLVSCFYLINKCSESVKRRFKCAIHSEMVILLFSTSSMTGALSNTTFFNVYYKMLVGILYILPTPLYKLIKMPITVY